MMHYEIYYCRNRWEIWKWDDINATCELFKTFKTKKGAESWAKKQWERVVWG